MLSSLLACAFACVALCSYWSNQDLFSPIKLYLLTLFICFFDIFLNPYQLEICCIYLGLLLVPLLLMKSESRAASKFASLIFRNKQIRRRRFVSATRTVSLIWILTIIPVASMTYLVMAFGGLTNYLGQLAIRHLAFQGLNTFSEVAINLISLLGQSCISVLESFGQAKVEMVAMLLSSSCLPITMLSMSGSRRYLLMPLLMILAVFHYFKSEISIRRAGAVLLLILSVTSVIGVLRMGQRGGGFLSRDLNDVERDLLPPISNMD